MVMLIIRCCENLVVSHDFKNFGMKGRRFHMISTIWRWKAEEGFKLFQQFSDKMQKVSHDFNNLEYERQKKVYMISTLWNKRHKNFSHDFNNLAIKGRRKFHIISTIWWWKAEESFTWFKKFGDEKQKKVSHDVNTFGMKGRRKFHMISTIWR